MSALIQPQSGVVDGQIIYDLAHNKAADFGSTGELVRSLFNSDGTTAAVDFTVDPLTINGEVYFTVASAEIDETGFNGPVVGSTTGDHTGSVDLNGNQLSTSGGNINFGSGASVSNLPTEIGSDGFLYEDPVTHAITVSRPL